MLAADNIIIAILLLGLIPVFTGAGVCQALRFRRSLSAFYAVGMFTVWALAQLLVVPCIFIQTSFQFACNLYLIVLLLSSVGGIGALVYMVMQPAKKRDAETDGSRLQRTELVVIHLLMAGLIGFIMYNAAVLQHTDADDATYVVNAVDMLRTDAMFRNLLTGEHTDNMLQFIKYLVAPWSFFGAFVSWFSGIKVTVLFHTVLPQVMILLTTAVYYELGTTFFLRAPFYRPVFVIFAWMFNLFGCVSSYTAETFLMMRSWQGKAVTAGIGVPMMILLFIEMYSEIEKLELFLLLALVNCSMCFMSGVGLALSCVMTGSFAFIYALLFKKPKLLLHFAAALLPNVVYGAFYLSLL